MENSDEKRVYKKEGGDTKKDRSRKLAPTVHMGGGEGNTKDILRLKEKDT